MGSPCSRRRLSISSSKISERTCSLTLASDSPAVIEVVSDIAKDYPPYKFHQPRLG